MNSLWSVFSNHDALPLSVLPQGSRQVNRSHDRRWEASHHSGMLEQKTIRSPGRVTQLPTKTTCNFCSRKA